MNVGIVVLRLLHVGSAILWAGGSVFIELFVEPVSVQLGQRSQAFVGALMARRMPAYFSAFSGTTVIVGSILYWIDSKGDPLGYLTGGGMGTALGIGGIAGWIAFLLGTVGIAPSAIGITKIQAEIGSGVATPAQEAELARLQRRLHLVGRVGLVLLAIAIVTMATGRYL